jgi:translation initiation factor IF-3
VIIKVKGLRINGGIRADKVRLVDAENNQIGIVERLFAMEKSREAGLDLVEVSPTSDPPVCRIMDYGKWVYEQKRKVREGREKTHHTGSLKEVRLRPETDTHDIEVKVKHAREFIEKGHKVQFTLIFRGRQMLHQDKGREVLNGIVETMSDIAKVDRSGEMMGKRMTLVVAPK